MTILFLAMIDDGTLFIKTQINIPTSDSSGSSIPTTVSIYHVYPYAFLDWCKNNVLRGHLVVHPA